ncbi:DUF4336 domain-containing protein [Massilia horti]|nr:DUF4336 domain-containing protein [Massilia horti]
MLQQVAQDIWHLPYHFTTSGVRLSTRMTVVRLRQNRLWLHSPVPVSPQVRAQLVALGEVAFIVAPNKAHHLFVGDCAAAFPDALVFVAPGLVEKRGDLQGLRELSETPEPQWQEELGQLFVPGIPAVNETVWFHHASRTLILTDLCQWWQGSIPLSSRLFATLNGVRSRLAVPYMIRLMVKDRPALGRSIHRMFEWDIGRVIVAHNAIVETDAREALRRAFAEVL